MTDAERLLDLLWCKWQLTGWGEIRAYKTIPPRQLLDGTMSKERKTAVSYWADLAKDGSIKHILDQAYAANISGWDIAHGVNPRLQGPSNPTAGQASNVPAYMALVTDWDDQPTVQRGLAALQRAGIAPSVVVQTGRGAHAYVLLDRPGPADVVYPLADAWCDVLESDGVHDASRILRTPGTRNLRVDKLTELVEFEPTRVYSLERLADAINYLRPARQPHTACAPPALTPAIKLAVPLPGRMQQALQGDFNGYKTRSEATMSIARGLAMRGYQLAEARSIMLLSALQERGSADIERCLSKIDWERPFLDIEPAHEMSTVVCGRVYLNANDTVFHLTVTAGKWQEQSCFQHVIPSLLPTALACFGIGSTGQASGRIGKVRLTEETFRGSIVLRVRRWYAAD